MDHEAALAGAGVTEGILSDAERRALDEQGFVVLREVLDERMLVDLRAAFERCIGGTGDGAGGGSGAPSSVARSGTRHVDRLPLDEPAFDVAYSSARVLACVQHVLGRPFRVLVAGGRDPLPGFGLQGLHQDWMPRMPGEPYRVVTALWLLDAFTATGGATRVVPRSHVVPRPLPNSMQAPAGEHPDQVLVTAPAGAVLVFNGHLWHAGTRNEGQRARRVLQLQLVAREVVPPGRALPVPERLSAPLLALYRA